jgi:adenylate cyclase
LSCGQNLPDLWPAGSAVDAVRCAMEIQRAVSERNADIPKERRVEFRIGINLGDMRL